MPEVFSPSRSLKYCRITLRTMEVSSFSRAASARDSPRCLGGECDFLVVIHVLQVGRVREEPTEELLDRGLLCRRIVERVHAGPEHGGVPQALRIPADVLAGHA